MENSSIFGITYNDWKTFVGAYLAQGNNYMKNYIYSYPLSKLIPEDKKRLLSEGFFNSYIASGLFLNDIELKKYNTIAPKNNGDFRNITLVSPIIYLVFITIGGHLAKQNDSSRKYDWISYAGNYKKNEMSYAPSYKKFSLATLGLQKSYRYYFKTDIASFYSMLNMGMLFNEIQISCKNESARSLMFYRKFLEYFGNGRFPVVSDNVGLSYIATVIYLRKFDEMLKENIENDSLIFDYQILRYVDDLYIAFNCDQSNYNKVSKHLKRYLQEVASKMKLKLNFQKQKVTETKNISDDVYANVYDYMANDEDIRYSDRYDESQIIKLIDNLLELPDDVSHEDIEKTIINVLDDHKFGFYYTEVLNWYIYKNRSVFTNSRIIDGLDRLLEKIDIFENFPKQFGRMIINTEDDNLIRKYLNKIFTLFRTNPTPKFIEFLAKEYLLAHNFKHHDLKEYICIHSPELYQYITTYCEGNYSIPKTRNYNNNYLERMNNDPILNYLWFRYKYAKNESENLEEFAYYKNYFDRRLTYFFAAMGESGVISKKGKISFQQTYNVQNVKKVLKDWKTKGFNYSDEDEEKLIEIYRTRNKNPVSHASSELLYENGTFFELSGYIQFLDDLLNRVKKFVVNEVEG